MADGVAISAGSGTTILTDDTGATGHAQVMKLAISTDGSPTLIPADATNGLASDVKQVVPGTGATNLGKAEDAAHTSGDVGVMVLGVRAAAPTDRSAGATDGDYEPIGVNEKGAIWVSQTASANGGASTMNATASDGGTALTNSQQGIKGAAGTLLGWYIYNPNAAPAYVQFYNVTAASVAVGVTNPLFQLTIPAASASNLWMPGGIAFSTAMSWSATAVGGGNAALTTAVDAICWYA